MALSAVLSMGLAGFRLGDAIATDPNLVSFSLTMELPSPRSLYIIIFSWLKLVQTVFAQFYAHDKE